MNITKDDLVKQLETLKDLMARNNKLRKQVKERGLVDGESQGQLHFNVEGKCPKRTGSYSGFNKYIKKKILI